MITVGKKLVLNLAAEAIAKPISRSCEERVGEFGYVAKLIWVMSPPGYQSVRERGGRSYARPDSLKMAENMLFR